MKIILRTKCGCERVYSEDAIPVPMMREIYVPLTREITFTKGSEGDVLQTPVRRFAYWKREEDGTTIFLEKD